MHPAWHKPLAMSSYELLGENTSTTYTAGRKHEWKWLYLSQVWAWQQQRWKKRRDEREEKKKNRPNFCFSCYCLLGGTALCDISIFSSHVHFASSQHFRVSQLLRWSEHLKAPKSEILREGASCTQSFMQPLIFTLHLASFPSPLRTIKHSNQPRSSPRAEMAEWGEGEDEGLWRREELAGARRCSDISDGTCSGLDGTDWAGIDFRSCLFYKHGTRLRLTIYIYFNAITYRIIKYQLSLNSMFVKGYCRLKDPVWIVLVKSNWVLQISINCHVRTVSFGGDVWRLSCCNHVLIRSTIEEKKCNFFIFAIFNLL